MNEPTTTEGQVNHLEKQLRNIKKAWGRIDGLEKAKAATMKEHQDKINTGAKDLKRMIEDPIPGTSDARGATLKAMKVTMKEIDDQKAAKASAIAVANKDIDGAKTRLKMLIENPDQMDLPGIGEDDDSSDSDPDPDKPAGPFEIGERVLIMEDGVETTRVVSSEAAPKTEDYEWVYGVKVPGQRGAPKKMVASKISKFPTGPDGDNGEGDGNWLDEGEDENPEA